MIDDSCIIQVICFGTKLSIKFYKEIKKKVYLSVGYIERLRIML